MSEQQKASLLSGLICHPGCFGVFLMVCGWVFDDSLWLATGLVGVVISLVFLVVMVRWQNRLDQEAGLR